MVSLLLATSAGSSGASGYIYELLKAFGVSDGTARHVQDLLLKPVTIVVIAIAAIVISHVGSHLIRRVVRALDKRAASRSDSTRLEHVRGRLNVVGGVTANLFRVVIWVIAILLMLGVLGIDLAPFLAGATIIGATIGFGAQNLVRDFLSGFLLLAEDQFRIGDNIDTGSATGTVEEMTLRVTRVRGPDGTTWYVPNGDIRTLGNFSRHATAATLDVLVPLGVPIEHACDVIAAAARAALDGPALRAACTRPPEMLGVEAADLTSVTIRLALYTHPESSERLVRIVRAAVTSALLDEHLLPDTSAAGDPPAPGEAAPPDQA